MIIIGADYHPSFQTIAFLIEETGEYEERELNHSDGEAVILLLSHSLGLDLGGIADPQLEIKFGQQALEPARKPGRLHA